MKTNIPNVSRVDAPSVPVAPVSKPEPKLTPLPWVVVQTKHGDYSIQSADLNGDGDYVAMVFERKDAQLLGAAPDLLEALQFVRKYANLRADRNDPLPSQLLTAVDAAIAKARGQS
jgi:hypothetical protein